MSAKKFILSVLLTAIASCTPLAAAETGDAETQLQELVTAIRAKLQDGKTTKEALAEDLKSFDALLEEHKGEKTDAVAQILVAKASLYLQVFQDTESALTLFKQLGTDYPETTQGKNAGQIIANIEQMEATKKVQESLVIGAAFPDFEEADLDGQPLSVAKYKGKIVLIDFWATWCGPCVAELPNVRAAYEEYHPKGFEIIGISLDREEQALTAFMEKRSVPWKQIFDGKGELAGRYGVQAIPTTYLLNGEGQIAAKNLRGPALKAELAKLLDK